MNGSERCLKDFCHFWVELKRATREGEVGSVYMLRALSYVSIGYHLGYVCYRKMLMELAAGCRHFFISLLSITSKF